ncbi:pyridoxal phosphate-dependent aminotransferase [Streptomyces sp. NPDC046985]|uniref:pyridoxal phosphate-dependent aminotransferase n=1 Tax=Streptomyces sp. NPDC046985 TaxID=3155377 RepID=UPI0033C8BC6D
MSTSVARRPAIAANLALHEEVEERKAAGQSIIHLGFGEARLPVFPGLVEQLHTAAGFGYAPVAGSREALTEVAGWFSRRAMPTAPDQVVLAPGSKPLLYALMDAIPGDVVLPRPCWVTYPAQARLARSGSRLVPVPSGSGGVPDPAAYRAVLETAERQGRPVGSVVLTLPDNPTGALAPGGVVEAVCGISREHGVVVISDEIYRDVLHDPAAPFRSPGELLDDGVVVTAGLSKSHGVGGWRVGTARFTDTPGGHRLRERVLGLASEVWSSLSGPMQAVAAYAYSEPQDLREHVRRCTAVHASVTCALHGIVERAGACCPRPAGGFYLYPDLEPHRAALSRYGVTDGASLQAHLLDTHAVAVLAGAPFGDAPSALRFRAATSLLYGDTEEERAEVLRSPTPAAVPHVRRRLDHLAEVFTALAG